MRVPGFDALRALAALGVVLFHYRAVRTAGDPALAAFAQVPGLDTVIAHGFRGVDVFFFLSGFLLVRPWVLAHCTGSPPPNRRDFFARRIRRIVPAYYAHLAFLFALMLPAFMGLAYVAGHAPLVAYNVAVHAAFLQFTTPLSSGSFGLNGALWTLTLEAEFYLLLPWLAPWVVRAPWRSFAAAVAIALAWRWLADHDLEGLVAWQLSLGARWSVPEAAVRDLLAKQLPGYAAHFALGMALGSAWWRREAAGHVAKATFLDGPAFQWAASVSYAVYLWHLPLLLVWNAARVLDGSPGSLPAYLFVLALVASASWRWIEQPFLGGKAPGRRL